MGLRKEAKTWPLASHAHTWREGEIGELWSSSMCQVRSSPAVVAIIGGDGGCLEEDGNGCKLADQER